MHAQEPDRSLPTPPQTSLEPMEAAPALEPLPEQVRLKPV